ncbi:hypothetical protein [Pseudonocardia sp. DLS-67]
MNPIPLMIVGVLLAVVIAVPIGLAVRVWGGKRALGEGGWTSGQQTARTLRPRDRWTVHWANTRGLPVRDPRLAAFAVRRGESVSATTARMMNGLRWLFWLGAALSLAVAVTPPMTTTAVLSFFYVVQACLLAFMPAWIQAGGRMAKRSADATRAFLAEHGGSIHTG